MNWTQEDLDRRNYGHCGCPMNAPHTATCPTMLGDMARQATTVRLTETPVTADLMPEWMIEAEATKLLEEDGWRALRTDPVSDRTRGKGFGEVGMADHLYIRYEHDNALWDSPHPKYYAWAEILWIEFKSAKGKPKSHQLDWHAKERARGALTWIAGVDFPASIEGFKAHYAASGQRRRI